MSANVQFSREGFLAKGYATVQTELPVACPPPLEFS